jgi:CelD/BcsL family acetyltransferase involved in cellulose biosynthesis
MEGQEDSENKENRQKTKIYWKRPEKLEIGQGAVKRDFHQAYSPDWPSSLFYLLVSWHSKRANRLGIFDVF